MLLEYGESFLSSRTSMTKKGEITEATQPHHIVCGIGRTADVVSKWSYTCIPNDLTYRTTVVLWVISTKQSQLAVSQP